VLLDVRAVNAPVYHAHVAPRTGGSSAAASGAPAGSVSVTVGGLLAWSVRAHAEKPYFAALFTSVPELPPASMIPPGRARRG
jgi:hypothetical protein